MLLIKSIKERVGFYMFSGRKNADTSQLMKSIQCHIGITPRTIALIFIVLMLTIVLPSTAWNVPPSTGNCGDQFGDSWMWNQNRICEAFPITRDSD